MSDMQRISPVLLAASLIVAEACDDAAPGECSSDVVEFTLSETAASVRIVSTLSPSRAELAFAEVAGEFSWDDEGVGPLAVGVIGSPTARGASSRTIGYKFFADKEAATHEVTLVRLDDTSDEVVVGFVSVRGEADSGCVVSIEVTSL